MYVCYSLRPKARGRDGHPFVVPWGLSGSPGREKKGPHPSAPPELVTMNGHGWDGIQCPLLTSEKTLKRVEYNCIGGGGSYKGGAVPPTDLRGIAQ